MKKVLMFVALIALVISTSSCSPATVQPPYVDPSFSRTDFSKQGITILPMGLASNVRDLNIPELRRYTGKAIFDALTTNFVDILLIPFETTLEKLQDNQLLDSWNQAQAGFEQSGILRTETMDKITTTLQTRYAFYPYLQSLSAQNGSYGSVRYSAAFSIIVWDKKIQKSVYEGSEAGYATSTLFVGASGLDAVKDALNSSIQKLVINLK